MKKIISILLLVLYSSTAFAITMDVHYCASKFSGISLIGYGGPHCGCDHSNSTHKGCCTDKIVSLKTDNHKTVQPYVLTESLSSVILSSYPDLLQHKYNSPEKNNNYHSASGFIRSHSPDYLDFLCISRI